MPPARLRPYEALPGVYPSGPPEALSGPYSRFYEHPGGARGPATWNNLEHKKRAREGRAEPLPGRPTLALTQAGQVAEEGLQVLRGQPKPA